MKQLKLFWLAVASLIIIGGYGWLVVRAIERNRPQSQTYMVDQQGNVWLKTEININDGG